MANTVQLKKDGQIVYPVTDVSLIIGLQDAIKLPPIKTATLPTASAETAGKMYYVGPDANDEYERYITSAVGGTYSWIDLGGTEIPLPSIADNLTTDDANTALSAKQGKVLNEEIEELEAKVNGFNSSFKANGVVNNLTEMLPSGSVILSVTSSGATPSDFNLYDENGTNQKNIRLSDLPYTIERDYYKGSTYVNGSPTLSMSIQGIEQKVERVWQIAESLEQEVGDLSDKVDGLVDEANYISGYRIENNNGLIEEYDGAILMKDFVPASNGDTILWRYSDAGAFPVGLSLYDLNKAYLGVTYWGANAAKERTFTLSNASVAYILASFKDSSEYSPEIQINGVVKWERQENGAVTTVIDEKVGAVESKLEDLSEKVSGIRFVMSQNPAFVSGKYCTYVPGTLKKVIGENAGIGYVKIDISSILTNIQIKNFKFVPSTGSADTYFKVICFDSSDNLLREWTAPNADDALLLTLSDIPNGTASIYLDTPVLHEDEIIVSFNVDVSTSIEPEEKESESVLLQYNKPIYTLGGSARSEQPLVLLHFSDIHGGSDNLSRIKDFFDGHSDKINDVLHTGDALPNDWDNSFTFWGASGASGFLNVIGNHDVASYTEGVGYDWTRYAGKDAYDRYFAPYISSWGVTQPENADTIGKCYYYKDYHDVRIIVIDDMSIMKDGDSAQLSWIESALTGARTSGKQVLIASHFPNQITPFSCPFQCIGGIGEPNTGRSAVVSLVDSFIGDGGIFVAWITGHTHCDLIGTVAGSVHTQVSITVSTANYQGVAIFDNINRVAGTPSMDLFNILKIDPYNKRLSLYRVGSPFDSDGRHIGTVTIDYENGILINFW